MILKLGVKHQAMELYKVYINHDHGMTLTFLRQGQLRSPMHLNGKNRKKNQMGETCSEYANGQKIYVDGKKFDPRRLSAPALGLNTCI